MVCLYLHVTHNSDLPEVPLPGGEARHLCHKQEHGAVPPSEEYDLVYQPSVHYKNSLKTCFTLLFTFHHNPHGHDAAQLGGYSGNFLRPLDVALAQQLAPELNTADLRSQCLKERKKMRERRHSKSVTFEEEDSSEEMTSLISGRKKQK